MRWPMTVLLLAAFRTALPTAAAAEDISSRVTAIEAHAYAQFQEGRYDAALDAYREAHALWALPALSFMEARCLEALGQLREAQDALARALEELGTGPDEALRGRIQQKMADVRAALREGRLVLLVEPAGAEVVVDGTSRGRAPIPPIALEPGSHVVEVRGGRDVTETRIATVEGGKETTERIVLPAPPEGPPEVPPRPWYRDTWGWVTLGTGVASGIVGATLLGSAESTRAQIRKLDDEDPVRSWSQQRAYSRWAEADDMAVAGWAMVGVGGAAIAASVVLFLVEDESSGQGTAELISVLPVGLPGGGGFALDGRF